MTATAALLSSGYVLEGALRDEGGRRVLVAQLADASQAMQLWNEHFAQPETGGQVGELKRLLPRVTIERLRANELSDDPTFRRQLERLYEGLRRAELPEGGLLPPLSSAKTLRTRTADCSASNVAVVLVVDGRDLVTSRKPRSGLKSCGTAMRKLKERPRRWR